MSLNKPCCQCNQIVYPLEQLKCLDQIWHRRCFRCETCGMALNMQNYRGYDKKPYCSAHYPQPKRFTVVADTPEMQRVAQNSRVLSNAIYRQDFYRTKGHPVSTVQTTNATSVAQAPNQRLSEVRLHQNNQPTSLSRLANRETTQQPFRAQENTRQPWSASVGSNHPPSHVNNGYRHANGVPTNGQTEVRHPTDYGTQFVQNAEKQEPVDGHPSPNTGSGHTHTSDYRSSNPNVKFRAMYDYEAREDDEVTFIEGDIILDGDPITDGWMYGTVQRTGQFGMLPSNYVELI